MGNIPIVEAKANGGKIEMEIIIGYAQMGIYEVDLWEKNKKDHASLMKGKSWDAIPDIFTVSENPGEADGKYVAWRINIISPSSQPGEKYSAIVLLRQDGKTLQGCPPPITGNIGPNQEVSIPGIVQLRAN